MSIDRPAAECVVCVGSSAGGLEALGELLAALPADLPFAYVIAQHVTAQLPSSLAELLAQRTSMAVRFADDGAPLAAGVVHVAPPGSDVVVDGATVRVVPPGVGVGPHPRIDRLLRSAARTWSERAVAVVLSGTGDDGAAGVVAVRGAGGLTIAERPQSARFAAMPAAAVATGAIDLVLPPREIGPALRRTLDQHGALRPPELEPTDPATDPARDVDRQAEPEPDLDEPVLRRICEVVGAGTGIDVGGYKRGTLRRQVARRMFLLRSGDPEAYLSALRADPGEGQALLAALLVPVTSFFRDEPAWTALREPLREIIDRIEGGRQLRVWVPGCATGQEAYSIGMLVAELMGDPPRLSQRVKIFATDLSETALTTARRGRYPADAVAGLPPGHQARWFRETATGLEVLPTLRETVVFARHDVMSDPPFPRVHLVSFRNALIYFSPAVQHRVLRMLHFGLAPDGLLLLGASERVPQGTDGFEPVDAGSRLYRRRATAGVPRVPLPLPGPDAPPNREPMTMTSSEPEGRSAMRDALIRRFAPASLVVDADDDVIEVVGNVSRWCWVAEGQHSTRVTALLREEFRPVVQGLLLRLRHGSPDPTKRRLVTADGVVEVTVRHLGEEFPALIVVSFGAPQTDAADPTDATGAPAPGRPSSEPVPPPRGPAAADHDELERMTRELASTEQALLATISRLTTSNEELQALNEELQASTEELQSSSEEVQASNEELEATNEELSSLNAELRARSDDLATANTDLETVQSSLTSGLVIVDRDLRVTRYTPLAVRTFALIESDLGRPLTAVPSTVDLPDLEQLLRAAVDEHSGSLVEVRGDHTEVLVQVQPYRAHDGAVHGAIVVATDVTELSEAHRAVQRSLRDQTAMTEALREVVWRQDTGGRLTFLNSRVEEVFGLDRELVLADPGLLVAAVHPDERARVTTARAAAGQTGYDLEYRVVRPDGETRWVQESGRRVRADADDPGYVVATALDVSDLHRMARRTRDRLSVLETVFDNDVFGVVVVDEDDRIVESNRFFARLVGYAPQALAGMPIMLLPQDVDAMGEPASGPGAGPDADADTGAGAGADTRRAPERAALALGIAHRRLISRHGTPYLVTVETRPLSEVTPSRRVVIVHDVTSLHESNRQLSLQTRFDHQTGLLTRPHFRVVLTEELARAARWNRSLAVLWIDLDGFKEVNDRHGHQAGDMVLREVASRLQRTARQYDAVARIGGDEFAMLVTDVDQQDSLESVAARALASLREPIVVGDSQVYVSGSIGVAVGPEDGMEADLLLHHADTAMYSAKQAGRDRRVYFRAEMNALAEGRAALRHHMAQAVRRRDFAVRYQPIVNARTGAVSAVEALVRWRRDGRIVAAADFLSLAKQTGQLNAIGRIALDLVAEQLAEVDDALGGVPILTCVNVDASQLEDRVSADWLMAWDPPGGYARILVEVTESAALADRGRPVETLNVLRRLGAKVGIDDFGTGYSNLEFLERLRPDVVKLDRSLLARALAAPQGLAVAGAAVQLAHALQAEVVVEGVESEALLRLARSLDAEHLQGHRLGVPMDLDELRGWADARPVGPVAD